jgi:hypothetical protein
MSFVFERHAVRADFYAQFLWCVDVYAPPLKRKGVSRQYAAPAGFG